MRTTPAGIGLNAYSWASNYSNWFFCNATSSPTGFCGKTFVDFGAGNAGAMDGYVYILGSVQDNDIGDGTLGLCICRSNRASRGHSCQTNFNCFFSGPFPSNCSHRGVRLKAKLDLVATETQGLPHDIVDAAQNAVRRRTKSLRSDLSFPDYWPFTIEQWVVAVFHAPESLIQVSLQMTVRARCLPWSSAS
jgi:hypothetical protein